MLQSFLDIFRGQRPDLTPAHLLASVTTGIPVLASLLAAFGIWHPSQEEQDALARALGWGFGLSALIVGGDGAHRVARNIADARVKAAALANPVGSRDHVAAVTRAVIDQLASTGAQIGGDGATVGEVSDGEEFAPGTGPDDEGPLESRAAPGPRNPPLPPDDRPVA